MRGIVLVGVLSACKYHGSELEDHTVTLVDDTAADFAGGTSTGADIDPAGAVTPAPYALFGLHAVAYTGKHVDAATTFATLDTELATLTPTGESYAQLPIDWGNAHPRNLALGAARNDDWSVVYDGEIHLPAGTTTIEIDADDAGLLRVTVDGTPFDVADATAGAKSVDVIAGADGWYPIRAAIADGNGNAKLTIKVAGAAPDPAQFRARIDTTGLLAQVYEAGHTVLDGTIVVPNADQTLGSIVPPPSYDIPITSTHTFQARFAGQIHIDQPGSWMFETASADQDSTRLWIDRVHVASKWGTNTFGLFDGVPATAAVELTAGWHHIAIDMLVEENDGLGGPAHPISMKLLATPPGGVAAPVDGALLRPVLSSAVATGVVEEPDHPLVIDGDTQIAIALPASDLRVRSIDAGAFLFHADANAYTVTLEANGTAIPMTDGATLATVFDDDTFAGQLAPTSWVLHFVDNQAGGSFGDPKTLFAYIDVTGDGGAALPFSQVATYVSRALPTPDAVSLGAIRTRSTLDGARLQLAVRTAASEDELAAATFVDVADGDVPDVAAGQFAQYRVTMTGDGWQFPVIDAIELSYLAP